MNLLFLGTSSGVPTKARNVTGIALRESVGNGWYLIDCGEGTQHQLLHTNLSVSSLKAIFITHIHGDHCYGLPGILASAGMGGRKDPLTIVAPKGIQEWFEATQEHTQLFLPFKIHFLCTDDLPGVEFSHTHVSVVPLSHRVPSYAYVFTEKTELSLDIEKLDTDGVPRGPLWGEIQKGRDVEVDGKTIKSRAYLLQTRASRKVVIAGDNDTPSLLAEACKDSHVLVHEATYTKDIAAKTGNTFGHSYAEQVAEFAESVTLPNLVLTHFSPRYQFHPKAPLSIKDIEQEARQAYSGELFLAEDFSEYHLDKSGRLSKLSE